MSCRFEVEDLASKLLAMAAQTSFANLGTVAFKISRSWGKVGRWPASLPLGGRKSLGYNVAQREHDYMTQTTVVRARIDARTKRQAAAALKTIGLTVSDAFRLLMVRVAAEKTLPFEPLNPNAETIAAMKAARRGDLINAGKPKDLLASLNAGDLNTRLVSNETTAGKSR